MITVYYDGLCKVCSKEISLYRNQLGSDSLKFVDICSQEFDAKAEGLDPVRVHQVMHVRRQDGTLALKVESFIEIWSVLPRFQWLAKAARWAPVNVGLHLGYAGFTMIRPFLPRNTSPADCSESPYCDLKSEVNNDLKNDLKSEDKKDA
ncbi:MAG: DUF393 domain-containing protein [Pseudomonadota bacterium]